jgi:hypothetical protein
MWKRKGGDERKQTLDARIYPVVSVGTKPPLVHVVEAVTMNIASRSPNLIRDSPCVAEPTWIIPAQVRESIPEGFNVLQTV